MPITGQVRPSWHFAQLKLPAVSVPLLYMESMWLSERNRIGNAVAPAPVVNMFAHILIETYVCIYIYILCINILIYIHIYIIIYVYIHAYQYIYYTVI